jgi:hypothetical protein
VTRTPAQAAYEARIAALRVDMPDGARVAAWDQLPAHEREAWTAVANAVAFAILHCDRVEGGLKVGDRVVKADGDYLFDGRIDALFAKQSGAVRAVVEDHRGILMILRPDQLQAIATLLSQGEPAP